jgi:hypothetical protein
VTTQEQRHPSTLAAENAELWPYEKALAVSIKDVVAELCLTDASILITYICNNLHANIDDLVASSTELFFREGTLSYGHSADVNFEWGKSPVAILDMEFIHQSVTVFFQLVLHGYYVGVAIQKILLGNKPADPGLDLQRFKGALANARLTPLPAGVSP